MNWQLIFLLSKANGRPYRDEEYPQVYHWDWPKKTWFQERLAYMRERQWQFEQNMSPGNIESFMNMQACEN